MNRWERLDFLDGGYETIREKTDRLEKYFVRQQDIVLAALADNHRAVFELLYGNGGYDDGIDCWKRSNIGGVACGCGE